MPCQTAKMAEKFQKNRLAQNVYDCRIKIDV